MKLNELQPGHVYKLVSWPPEDMVIVIWANCVFDGSNTSVEFLLQGDELLVVSSKNQNPLFVQKVQVIGCNREFLGWICERNELLGFEEILPS